MKSTYEVLEETSVVNQSNEPVKKLSAGDTITGEMVLIDDQPYVETSEGFVKMTALAEKLEAEEISQIENEVKSSSKKLIFAMIGGAVGFAFAHYRGMDMKKKVFLTIGGMALGLAIDYINEKRK